MTKPQCEVCGKKEGRHDEFGYRVGYYEETFNIGGRSVTYQICTRCKRLVVKGGSRDFNGFGSGPKRTVYIPDGTGKSGPTSSELFETS